MDRDSAKTKLSNYYNGTVNTVIVVKTFFVYLSTKKLINVRFDIAPYVPCFNTHTFTHISRMPLYMTKLKL